MKRSFVEKAQTWERFADKIPGGRYTAVGNRRLDEIYRNPDRPLEDRFDAFLLRSSWGNFMDYACDRVTKSQAPARQETPIEQVIIKPLVQADFARILGADPRRIQELVKLRQDQGLMARREELVNPGLLVPLQEPQKPRPKSEDEPEYVRGTAWRAFEPLWERENPERAQKLKEAAEILKEKLAAFKAFQKLQDSTDAAGPNSPDAAAGASPELPGRIVRNSPDEMTATPRTPKTDKARSVNALEKTESGQTLNLTREEISKEQPPSVGRSSSSNVEPTDRPTGGSSPYKEKVREWLEKNFSLSMAIEDPELGQIADTLRTDTHFDQFQKAALKAKAPKGWKYFVTVALNCQQHQEKYAAAAAGGSEPKPESTIDRMMQIRKEVEENERHSANRRRAKTGQKPDND